MEIQIFEHAKIYSLKKIIIYFSKNEIILIFFEIYVNFFHHLL
jgi:hypothetical protein